MCGAHAARASTRESICIASMRAVMLLCGYVNQGLVRLFVDCMCTLIEATQLWLISGYS